MPLFNSNIAPRWKPLKTNCSIPFPLPFFQTLLAVQDSSITKGDPNSRKHHLNFDIASFFCFFLGWGFRDLIILITLGGVQKSAKVDYVINTCSLALSKKWRKEFVYLFRIISIMIYNFNIRLSYKTTGCFKKMVPCLFCKFLGNQALDFQIVFFSWKLRSIRPFWIQTHFCAILAGQDIYKTKCGLKQINSHSYRLI